MKYTPYGFPLPDANDCAACAFGTPHHLECPGVYFEGERIYNSGAFNIQETTEATLNRWLG